MINKKIKAGVLVFVAVILFVLMYSFITHKLFWKSSENINQTDGAKSLDLPKTECHFTSDQDAYKNATEAADINVCSCVSDEELRGTCEDTVNDLGLYLEALRQYDPKLCDEILDSSRKEACISVIQSGVDYLKEKNPQYLANIYAISHSEESIGEYEALLEKDPNNVNNLIALSLSYAEKGLNEQGRGKDQSPYVEKALEAIGKAKSIDADNSEIYRVEGYAYEIKPDIAKALEDYNKAIDLDGKNILAYAGRGHAHDLAGATDDALLDFNKAAELDVKQEYGVIYSNLCRLGIKQAKSMDVEIKNCKLAIRENNDIVSRSESLQILSSLYIPIREYSQANSYLMKAKELTPNDPNLHITFANLYLAQGEFKKAEDSARKAIELFPTKAYAYLTLSYALKDQNNFNEAIEAINKGLSFVDNDVSLLQSSKSGTKKMLYYSLADLYKFTNNNDQEMKYKQLGDEIN